MMFLLLNWVRKNFNLVLLSCAAICLSAALAEVIRGGAWSLLVTVSLAGVLCGWWLGSSRLAPKQAWAGLIGLGIPGVFLYVAGLISPVGRFFLSLYGLVPQINLWIFERVPVDIGPFIRAWIEMSEHAANALARLWLWSFALVKGNTVVDLSATALVWSLLLWLVCAWSGWQFRRERRALSALAPGGALLALVIDYTRGEVWLVIVYLALLLVLMGLSHNQGLQTRWQRRKVDYSDSVAFETLLMTGMVTIGLVLSAAGMPSLSWRELLDRLRKEESASSDQVAESLGLEAPPNAAYEPAYRSEGLPREHLLTMPPELLKDVVLEVSTGEIPPLSSTTGPESTFLVRPERYYWRSITYDVYTGEGWSSSPAQEHEVPAGTLLLELPQNYRVLNQQIRRAPEENAYVFWSGLLAQADADIKIAWRTAPPQNPGPHSNGDMLGALTRPDEYTVVSYLPRIGADQLRAAGTDYPSAIARRYLRLPESLPDRVRGLAREVTQAALTPYDRALAIETYLRSFPYTLEVEAPPAGRDVVDYFLFTARQGYCDYYASAMVVLARAVGLPARIVVGYTSGEYNAETAQYVIRKENAHSWTEVYFPGYGWVEFEPTAGQPALERTEDESAAGLPPGLPPGQQALSWLKTRWRDLIASLGGQLLIAGTAFIALIFLWQVGEIGFLRLIPASKAIARMYSRMEKASSHLVPDLPGGHTPYQLQAALTGKLASAKGRWHRGLFSGMQREIEDIASLYIAQVYSPHQPERSQIKRGILSWARLRWRLWVAGRWVRFKANEHTL